MNNMAKYGFAICVALGISFMYNVELTFAIFLANIASSLIIKDDDMANVSEEELMRMLPKSLDDISEMVMVELTKGSVNTCFIVVFYNCLHTIYG
jgi:bifunctional ADP-heptose synthase (sugar kinase/adenylyltransferase)